MKKKKIISVALSFLLVFSLGVFTPNNAQAFADEALNSVKDGLNAIAENLENQQTPLVDQEQTTVDQAQSASNETPLATIFATNDVHGNIDQCINDELGLTYGLSYANVAKLKADAGKNGILVDAGDHTSGGLYANYDWGYTMVDLLKASYYDLAIPGNHEFDYGMDSFFRANEHAGDSSRAGYGAYNYYACNLFHVDAATQQKQGLVLDPYKVVVTDSGLRVAFVGVMTQETISKSSPAYFQDAEGNYIYTIDGTEDMYKDFDNAVQKAWTEGQADVVIGIGHLGVDETSEGNTSKALVQNTSNKINAFIDGHSHSVFTETWTNKAGIEVKALQTGTAFANVGKITVYNSDLNGDYTVNTELLANTSFDFSSRNENVIALEKAWKSTVDSKYVEEVAVANYPFWFSEGNVKGDENKRWVRRFETNLTDLVADSLYWTSNFTDCGGADVAICNGGGIKHYFDDQSVITLKTIADVLPYRNQFGIATFSGSLLREVLEFSYRDYGKYDSDGLLLENGGLMACSGIQFSVDPNKDSTVVVDETKQWISGPSDGQYRVQNIKIYNKQTGTYDDIDLNKQYKVAGITYFFKNYGDGFNMFRNKEVSIETFDLAPDVALANYFSAFGLNSSNSLPVINTANCPLNVLPNFQLNYENAYGGHRVGAYNVSFDTNGGSYVPDQNVLYDEPVIQPALNPTKVDNEFAGWFADSELTTDFDFASLIDSDTTVYAKWNPVLSPESETGQSGTPQTSDSLGWLYLMFVLAMLVSGSIAYNRKRNELYRSAKHINR